MQVFCFLSDVTQARSVPLLACAYGQRTVTFENESHAPGELGKSCSSLAVRTTGAAKQRQVAVLQQSEHKILPELIRQQGN
jgi:hypothetical protein